MVVCIPVMPDGTVDPRFGRAARMAVLRVEDGTIVADAEHQVDWDVLHDAGPEGTHHGRIVRFLMEHEVEAVVAGHVGPPMVDTMTKMGIRISMGAAGDARVAVLAAAAAG
jgi:predicted Fe-Mo cluster-binding NifX family protein